MPCYTVNRTSVEFKAENHELLEDAVRSLGYAPMRTGESVTFYAENGPVTISGGKISLDERDRKVVNKLKREYAHKGVEKLAAKYKPYGWVLKKTSASKYELVKRG